MSQELVSLVIPGRNCASTIGQCLSAVVPMLETTPLGEIIFVDDGSTDETGAIVAGFGVEYVAGSGRGPGSARNIGWQRAKGTLVWFVDSDCVAEPDALTLLLPHMDDPNVGGVGGSYGSMTSESLLARLIHEEIVERHLAMPRQADFLASFNLIFRKTVLEEVGGFDERFLKAQDAELAWRVLDAGHGLAFEVNSRVKHFHPVSWRKYMSTQRQQGHWRMWLYAGHRRRARGDSYSGVLDHVQPPLAMLVLASLPLVLLPGARWVLICASLLLLAAQIPMALRLIRRKRDVSYAAFGTMSLIRAFARGIGMTGGVLAILWSRLGGGRKANE